VWVLVSIGLGALAVYKWRAPSVVERPGVFESSSAAERRFWLVGRRTSALFIGFCAALILAANIARLIDR
jgi:hypothetical protein